MISLPYRLLTDENGQQVEKRGIYVGEFLEDTVFTRLPEQLVSGH